MRQTAQTLPEKEGCRAAEYILRTEQDASCRTDPRTGRWDREDKHCCSDDPNSRWVYAWRLRGLKRSRAMLGGSLLNLQENRRCAFARACPEIPERSARLSPERLVEFPDRHSSYTAKAPPFRATPANRPSDQ